jgi:hypothetical protein
MATEKRLIDAKALERQIKEALREKLIEVLGKADKCNAEFCKDCEFSEDLEGCRHRQKEIIADVLIANGVTIKDREIDFDYEAEDDNDR